MADNELLQKLSQNLLEILDDDEYCDITIEVDIFQIILRYLYGGKLSLEEYDTLDIIKILIAANELSLQELVTQLQKYCTNLISEDPDKIFESLDFSKIPENLLSSIIQCDNLQMDEVQIWDHTLKWGLAQNPEEKEESNTDDEDMGRVSKQNLHMIDKNYKVDDYKSVTYKNKLIKHINAKGYISKDEDYTTDEDITKE
ncbi:BTB/POZ protein [Rhizophagus irregularis DAOM 181602=DAOM 197198]|nr:BTB/POZ protein [Rhizophagus irregularis DAOM 181602=DAOM 197198]